MAYQALVHRATGLLYFSYWPRQPRTWQAIAGLNAEVQQLVPRLVASGREIPSQSSRQEVQVRVRQSGSIAPSNQMANPKTKPRSIKKASSKDQGPLVVKAPVKPETSGMMIAINTSPHFVRAAVRAEVLEGELRMPFENRTAIARNHIVAERFAPYEAHVYTWGAEPESVLAGE